MTPNLCPSVTDTELSLQTCVLKEKDAHGFPEASDTSAEAAAGGRNQIGFKRTTDLEFSEITPAPSEAFAILGF